MSYKFKDLKKNWANSTTYFGGPQPPSPQPIQTMKHLKQLLRPTANISAEICSSHSATADKTSLLG